MTLFASLDSVSCRTPGGDDLFADLSLTLGAERTGLVGRNGAGKTSLLRLILGEIAPHAGAVSVTGRLGVLSQSVDAPATASIAGMMGVAAPLARLERLQRGEGAAVDLDAAQWDLPGRIEEALSGLGLAGLDLARSWLSLSGGESTRARLAALLIDRPDLLLLDEPTNNLDAQGRTALRDFLAGWSGGALVVSHDRDLLRGMDRILELTGQGAKVYGGGWDLYAARKTEAEAAAERDLGTARQGARRVARETQRRRETKERSDAAGRRASARGGAPRIVLGAKARQAERSGARQTRLGDRRKAAAEIRLQVADARVERSRRLSFGLPSAGLAAGKLVLAFDAVSFAWPGGRSLFEDLNLRLAGPRRIAVTGGNGRGKTTFIGLALGDVAPTRGRVTLGVRAVRLDQQLALLDDTQSLIGNFRRLNPAALPNDAHAALARFLFRNTAALQVAGALSGGERLRAALACVLMGPVPPQLIVLDEPTNHLDLDSIAAVEAALADFDGALLVASHDDDFLSAIGVEGRLDLGP